MSDRQGGGGVRKIVAAAVIVPAFVFTMLISLVLTFDTAAAAACDLGGAAVLVDPASVPAGPIAGWDHEQLVNAAYVMLAAQRLGLTVRDQQIGVMTAMGESSLRVLDYGDEAGPDSRGLFQQRANGAWGTLADRMDPFISSTNFFKVEMTIEGRQTMAPTLVAHEVQRNADPWYYEPFWADAGLVVQGLSGVRASTSGSTAPTSTYNLGSVKPQTALVANTLGPMFGIKTIGGYRPPEAEQYDPNGHPAGLALDFMINDIPAGTATGDRLAAYAQDHADDLGVLYLIWQQRIWSPARADEGWRPMEDRGSPTQNHMDHVHMSLSGAGTGQLSGCPQGQGQLGEVNSEGWAAPGAGPITSTYGPRVNPVTGVPGFHYGIDLAAGGCGGPIWASNAGTVIRAGAATGYGNLIEVDHGDVITRYAHMYDSGVLVYTGQRVQAGQQIAKTGTTGNSTGCHLHFEVLLGGSHVDPKQFLDQVNVTIP